MTAATMTEATAVFDIGKTNVKLTLVDHHGQELAVRRRPNATRQDGPYPHHDVATIEAWLLENLTQLARRWHIAAIVPVAHGATAALVDDEALVLPVADYEHDFQLPGYDRLRAPFEQTFSPRLDLGLNLGRQLYWQQQQFPQAFGRARHVLMYPQYWAWRLCGVMAAEVSSLGCHTDLWQPGLARYSTLVEHCGWSHLMPPLRHAWDTLGTVRPALVASTGLPADCRVLCGVHDSNASLVRHLEPGPDRARIVLSTGTWVIAAALDGQLAPLQEHSDMLANVNVVGAPVACMRFMGGREFAQLAGATHAHCTLDDLQALLDAQVMAHPCFAECGGPFATRQGRITGQLASGAINPYALATLYCALMTDYCLEQLQAPGGIVVEGSFTANPHFAPLLAALTQRRVSCSQDSSGTTVGGWLLGQWGNAGASDQLGAALAAPALSLPGLERYRQAWRTALAEQDAPVACAVN
ncbi:FGGY-family carbohydrate kinase [Herbaspirillum sp. alder98]|uniref:FGGY-family carbohydrate kinase n=1 Tax=Herbaspirillum sp. alder98 TaxID=2913096 RepID=UPI001CD8BCB9|nr:FGGY family carbohydrate kinase [Herbaspirillum sp. alder98]MCA1326343.1 L-fuculose kinase [Herbaspirillum sp. alder98]